MKAKNLDNERMYPFVSNTTMNEGYYGLTLFYILYFCVTGYSLSDNKVSFFINDFPLRVMRNGMKKQLWPWISNLDNDKLFFRSNKRCLDTPQKLFLNESQFTVIIHFSFCRVLSFATLIVIVYKIKMSALLIWTIYASWNIIADALSMFC